MLTAPVQVIPRALGAAGRAVSDFTLMGLHAIRVGSGSVAADDMAAGYCDGAARYWRERDAETAPDTRQAAE